MHVCSQPRFDPTNVIALYKCEHSTHVLHNKSINYISHDIPEPRDYNWIKN